MQAKLTLTITVSILAAGQSLAQGQDGAPGSEPKATASAVPPRADAEQRRQDEAVARQAGILGMLERSEDSAVQQVLGTHDLGAGMDAAASKLTGERSASMSPPAPRPRSSASDDKGRSSLSIGALGPATAVDEADLRTRPRTLVRPGRVRTVPGMDSAHVKSVMDSATPNIDACTDSQLRRHPNFRGTFDAQIVVGANGRVEDTQILVMDGQSPRMIECLKSAFGRLRFSPPKGGGTVVIRDVLILGRR